MDFSEASGNAGVFVKNTDGSLTKISGTDVVVDVGTVNPDIILVVCPDTNTTYNSVKVQYDFTSNTDN